VNGKYGPQTEAIEALLERVEAATEDEIGRLHAFTGRVCTNDYTVTWYTARHSGRGSEWDTVVDACSDLIIRVAKGPAWYGALRIAQYSALGLAVRDLIGSYGFTQEHYDDLTGPWRKVVGKVHPNDVEV
jgi:hypothetical protein